MSLTLEIDIIARAILEAWDTGHLSVSLVSYQQRRARWYMAGKAVKISEETTASF